MESPHSPHRGPETSQPLIAEYERTLRTTRALSDATVRNYVADLAPFLRYMDGQNCQFGADTRASRFRAPGRRCERLTRVPQPRP